MYPKDLLGWVIFVPECTDFGGGVGVDWEVFGNEGEDAVPGDIT